MNKNKFLKENGENIKTVKDPLIFEGVEFLKMEEGDGNIELGLEVKDTMMNPNGIMHGGMIYTLGDMCAGLGAFALGHKVSTIQGGMNYLRPATGGKIVAKNDVKHEGRTTVVSSVNIYNDQGKMMATGTYTMAILGPAY